MEETQPEGLEIQSGDKQDVQAIIASYLFLLVPNLFTQVLTQSPWLLLSRPTDQHPSGGDRAWWERRGLFLKGFSQGASYHRTGEMFVKELLDYSFQGDKAVTKSQPFAC